MSNKLEMLITKAWQEQSPWLKLLAPLSMLYQAVSTTKKWAYHRHHLKTYHAAVPVLVIGNITVGGSGKTPLIIALVSYLQAKGVSVGVIARGYGGDAKQMPALVTADSTPKQVGDEPCLIVQSTGVPMAVGANRGQAIELLLSHHADIKLIISDDGLQHHALHRDAEWIVVDAKRGFGNQKLFPQGFLREPVSRLVGATVVYHDADGSVYDAKALRMWLEPAPLEPLLRTQTRTPPQAGDQVCGLTGIGYPKRFFETLRGQGFDVLEVAFGDHHEFDMADLTDLPDCPIVVTAKDAVKLRLLSEQCRHDVFKRMWVLPVNAKFSDAVYEQLAYLQQRLL